MAVTPSSMQPLGFAAPAFTLPDAATGKNVALSDIRGPKGTAVFFICNHCPFVVRIQEGLAKFGSDYMSQGIGVAAISANDIVNYPQDAPDKMKELSESLGLTFPYLFDETQEVAQAYGATCTPDLFLFDSELKCAYRGQFDEARPGNNKPVTGEDLRKAADLLIAGKPVPVEDQKPSIGCSIKWK